MIDKGCTVKRATKSYNKPLNKKTRGYFGLVGINLHRVDWRISWQYQLDIKRLEQLKKKIQGE